MQLSGGIGGTDNEQEVVPTPTSVLYDGRSATRREWNDRCTLRVSSTRVASTRLTECPRKDVVFLQYCTTAFGLTQFFFSFFFFCGSDVLCMCGAVLCWCMCGAVRWWRGGLGVAEVMELAICRVGDKMANGLVSRTCWFIAWAVVALMWPHLVCMLSCV